MMPLKAIYNRNFGFIEQKKYFWALQRASSKKNPINGHLFAMKKVLVDLFRAAPLYAYVGTTQRCAVPLNSAFPQDK